MIAVGGGAAGVAYLARDHDQRAAGAARTSSIAAPAVPDVSAPAIGPAPHRGTAAGLGDAASAATGDRDSREADRTATRDPYREAVDGRAASAEEAPAAAAPVDAAAAPVAASPAITTQTVTETRPIPYQTRFVRDPAMPRGTSRVQTPGVDGVQTMRWLVTREDGRETDRRLIGSSVTRPPQHRIVAIGVQRHGRGWGRPRECDAGLGPCIHWGRTCPDRGQPEESADQLAALAESLGLLTPGGGMAGLETLCPMTTSHGPGAP